MTKVARSLTAASAAVLMVATGVAVSPAGATAAGATTTASAALPAAAAPPASAPTATLPQPLPAATKRVSGDPKLTFYWGLARNDSAAAARSAIVSDPTSGSYRQFLSAKQVANGYGASTSTVKQVKNYLAKKGLKGKLDKSRLFLRVIGTASAMQRAFKVPVKSIEEDGFEYFVASPKPKLPKKIRKLAPERFWISQRQLSDATASDRLIHRDLPSGPKAQARALKTGFPVNDGRFIGCQSLKETLVPIFGMSFPQGTKAYGINKLRSKSSRGDIANRPAIGVIAQGSGYSDELLTEARNCMGFKGSAYRVETDGVNQLPSGGEGNLDIQTVLTALSSSHRVPVYESVGAITNFLAPVAALNSRSIPRVLTISYGVCEPELRKSQKTLNDAIYQRLSLVGTSVLAAAGDRGSSGCINNETGEGPTAAAVSYPSSSPWVTGVGGTRIVLTAKNKRAKEVAWNDSAWGLEVAGGGGVSILYSRPSWQQKSVTGGSRRSVPDLSAHASLFPGWYVFGEGIIGGTSAATPLTATGIALLSETLANEGKSPLGLLNPLLYTLPKKATYDITKGNTDLHNNGCCTAKKGYDRATGIGSPNFGKWRKLVR